MMSLPGTRTIFHQCTIAGTARAAVHVANDGTPLGWQQAPRFDECTIGGSGEGGVFVYHGGAVTLRHAQIRDCALSAIEVAS